MKRGVLLIALVVGLIISSGSALADTVGLVQTPHTNRVVDVDSDNQGNVYTGSLDNTVILF